MKYEPGQFVIINKNNKNIPGMIHDIHYIASNKKLYYTIVGLSPYYTNGANDNFTVKISEDGVKPVDMNKLDVDTMPNETLHDFISTLKDKYPLVFLQVADNLKLVQKKEN